MLGMRNLFCLSKLALTVFTGAFSSTYKFLINALPILIPSLNPSQAYDDALDEEDLEEGPSALHPNTTLKVPLAQRSARLSLSAQAQLVLVRKKTRRWHAALAGALAGGIAIMFEKRGRRGVIAQQMFVRWVNMGVFVSLFYLTASPPQRSARLVQRLLNETQFPCSVRGRPCLFSCLRSNHVRVLTAPRHVTSIILNMVSRSKANATDSVVQLLYL